MKDLARAQIIAERFAEVPQVSAITLGGSQVGRLADERSDLDLYIYTEKSVPLAARMAIAAELAQDDAAHAVEINNQFWETGDEWIDSATGLKIDLMYRTTDWIEDELIRVLVKHCASVGYSTCLWANVRYAHALYDPDGWFGRLQHRADQPYPAPLKQAIVAKNYPILRSTQSSYRAQLTSAARRQDRVSVNHRIAALLASYFDILFAANEVPHPGEKRLVALAQQLCRSLPDDMAQDVDAVLRDVGLPWDQFSLRSVDRLLDRLDQWLETEHLR